MTKTIFTSLIALGLAITSLTFTAEAAPSKKYKAALSSAKNLDKAKRKFTKQLKTLSVAELATLKQATSKLGEDSDQDGVSDIYEGARGSNLCNSDSDGDGTPDNEDQYEDQGGRVREVQAEGVITDFSDPNFTVGSKTFTVDSSTTFRKGLTSKDDLDVGVCVGVEGYQNSTGASIATKIEGKTGCDNGDDGSED